MPARLAALVLVAAGCAGAGGVSSPAAPPLPLAFAAAPAGLVAWAGGAAVAVGDTVWTVRDGVARAVALPGRTHGLAAGADTLWAATDAGLYALAGNAPPARVAVPGERVLAVALEADGAVWAATFRGGVHVRRRGAWAAVSGSPYVSGVAPTAGGVWLGTHQGVVRLGDAPARFTEEGTTEHGLYDNVVDRLFATADGVVWAVHPEGVSVFADGEPHGFAFVGRRGAALLDAVAVGAGHVLATTAGLLAVPALPDRPAGFYEVYADSGTDARPLALPVGPNGAPAVRLAVGDGVLWLASRAGVWSVPLADLLADAAWRATTG